ncbi:transmembrane protein 53 [Impatiens glandulifera]|uniref:transmembrane protein 53 n=1 Tax=Impatiens glandulifera TaxID=253017 RepID=UPI001FB0C380|nr:transmembrane protein 53 [Impatiens glandulifera]
MSSFSGLQRPVFAAAAVAVASVSAELHEKFRFSGDVLSSKELSSISKMSEANETSWVSHISVSKFTDLSFVSKIRIPVPEIRQPTGNARQYLVSNVCWKTMSASPCSLVNSYQSAELAKSAKPTAVGNTILKFTPSSEVLYRWHLPEINAVHISGNSDCLQEKSKTVVVLLGWLGSKQKHLSKYAEWYTDKGFHVITFTFPMAEILSYKVGGKAEEQVELLTKHLVEWLEEEHEKNIVFHTFSNTGWLTYGVILEKLQNIDVSLMGRIKGCIVDSAPVASPDPQVWASGFSAALLKKNSVATKGSTNSNVDVNPRTVSETKPAISEAALLLVLEKFFNVVLNLPTIHRRLLDVMGRLSSQQPSCPQLYIYSSADRVIPVRSVEMFIEEQRKTGHEVRACNFISTPHVDHFRNNPILYTSQLTQFFDDCVLDCCNNNKRTS